MLWEKNGPESNEPQGAQVTLNLKALEADQEPDEKQSDMEKTVFKEHCS